MLSQKTGINGFKTIESVCVSYVSGLFSILCSMRNNKPFDCLCIKEDFKIDPLEGLVIAYILHVLQFLIATRKDISLKS